MAPYLPPLQSDYIHDVNLTPPSLQDNLADADRLLNELRSRLKTDRIDLDLSLLKQLPHTLRASNYRVRCVLCRDRGRGHLLAAIPFQEAKIFTGLAIDLGTTRVALRLIDLTSGKTINFFFI